MRRQLGLPLFFSVLLALLHQARAAESDVHQGQQQERRTNRLRHAAGKEIREGRHGRRVCIVGAGSSGLSAGLRLQSKGYNNVVVFEKEAIAGGKARDYTAPDNVTFPLGAVFGILDSNNETLKLLSRFNVPLNVLTGPAESFTYYDIDTGALVPSLALPPTNTTQLNAAIVKYLSLRYRYAKYLVPGFINGVPSELLVDSYAWLATNGLSLMVPALYLIVTAFGYGSLTTLPVIYLLIAIDEGALTYTFSSTGAFTPDWAELWPRVAATMNVHYRVKITEVTRCNKGVQLTHKQHGSCRKRKERCDSLIVAFASRLDLLEPFDLDKLEQAVFQRVRTNDYYSGLVRADKVSSARHGNLLKATGNPAQPFTISEPVQDGRPIFYFRTNVYGLQSEYTTFYSWCGANVRSCDVFNSALQAFSVLNRDDSVTFPISEAIMPLTPADIPVTFKWDYFPHFDTATVSPTIFEQLEDLQGHRSTYWLSSLRCSETEELVVRSAYDIVDRYF